MKNKYLSGLLLFYHSKSIKSGSGKLEGGGAIIIREEYEIKWRKYVTIT